jgi:hypothetical protein
MIPLLRRSMGAIVGTMAESLVAATKAAAAVFVVGL